MNPYLTARLDAKIERLRRERERRERHARNAALAGFWAKSIATVALAVMFVAWVDALRRSGLFDCIWK